MGAPRITALRGSLLLSEMGRCSIQDVDSGAHTVHSTTYMWSVPDTDERKSWKM